MFLKEYSGKDGFLIGEGFTSRLNTTTYTRYEVEVFADEYRYGR